MQYVSCNTISYSNPKNMNHFNFWKLKDISQILLKEKDYKDGCYSNEINPNLHLSSLG